MPLSHNNELSDATTEAPEIDPAHIRFVEKYCATCWRNAHLPFDDWPDATQEVICRLLGSVPGQHWDRLYPSKDENAEDSDERKEFLRAIDAVKKRVQRSKRHPSLTMDIGTTAPTDEIDQRTDLDEQWAAIRSAADGVLTPAQLTILERLRGGDGVREIATAVGRPVERISDEKYRAIRALHELLAATNAAPDTI